MTRRPKIVSIGVTGGLLLAALVGRGRIMTETTKAEAAELQQTLLALGAIVPSEGIVNVRPHASGVVISVLAKEGEHVERGQLLAEIVSPSSEYELRRRQAERDGVAASVDSLAAGARPEERASLEAEVRAAEAELATQHDRRIRLEGLRDAGSATEAALAQARFEEEGAQAHLDALRARLRLLAAGSRPADLAAARARLSAAEAAFEAARSEQEAGRVTAPISGTVLARHAALGDSVSATPDPGTPPLFELAELSRTMVRAEVEEVDANRVATGMPVSVQTIGGRVLLGTGTVVRAAERIEPRTIGNGGSRDNVRVVWVDAAWDPAIPSPRVGQQVEVAIRLPPIHAERVLPRRAIDVRNGKAYVEVPWGLGWRSVQVELGATDATRVEVLTPPIDVQVRLK